ncbi:MAG: Sapep family Mn(2+)-dependent dipeptidase [Raoultibacter sp.]
MTNEELSSRIDEYIENNWEAIIGDIDALVRIESTEDMAHAADGAPYGPGPAKALSAALDLAAHMGFDAHNCEGHIGYADFPGESETQIGIIGHMDVVPAGIGWTMEPFQVNRKEGYLIGRGVLDDKGPSVMALHAMKFWKDQGITFPYTLRFIFGANEESGMRDVTYYREHFADPAFLFTPDADFPVCYGEKGGYDGHWTSKPIVDGVIVELEGGTATNAIPSLAHAVVRADAATLPATDAIKVEAEGELVRLSATGKGGHASLPEGTLNAIGLLVDYLLEHDLCNADERAFLELTTKLFADYYGSGLGIDSEDEYFGKLTVIGGTAHLKDGRLVQTIDSRFPTSITDAEITQHLSTLGASVGADFENTLLMKPFLVKPDSPMIQALLNAYNEATGEQAKPFTMGGGTYAREFTSGASFGPNRAWVETPAWVGTEHGPDEGISEELLKSALKIYALTINELMKLKY